MRSLLFRKFGNQQVSIEAISTPHWWSELRCDGDHRGEGKEEGNQWGGASWMAFWQSQCGFIDFLEGLWIPQTPETPVFKQRLCTQGLCSRANWKIFDDLLVWICFACDCSPLVNAVGLQHVCVWLKRPQRASQVVLVIENPPARAGNIGDHGSIPGLWRTLGGRHSNAL